MVTLNNTQKKLFLKPFLIQHDMLCEKYKKFSGEEKFNAADRLMERERVIKYGRSSSVGLI